MGGAAPMVMGSHAAGPGAFGAGMGMRGTVGMAGMGGTAGAMGLAASMR